MRHVTISAPLSVRQDGAGQGADLRPNGFGGGWITNRGKAQEGAILHDSTLVFPQLPLRDGQSHVLIVCSDRVSYRPQSILSLTDTGAHRPEDTDSL